MGQYNIPELLGTETSCVQYESEKFGDKENQLNLLTLYMLNVH